MARMSGEEKRVHVARRKVQNTWAQAWGELGEEDGRGLGMHDVCVRVVSKICSCTVPVSLSWCPGAACLGALLAPALDPGGGGGIWGGGLTRAFRLPSVRSGTEDIFGGRVVLGYGGGRRVFTKSKASHRARPSPTVTVVARMPVWVQL